ncbi:MAG TPA: helix-turn-helix transcriptional regulator [Acidimicrobiales bacterium]|nr:helix-turn-helix transcriptional regulator [Acidimicrobiales bacterium]
MPTRAVVRPDTTLAGRIARARRAAGLSREQLAVAIGRTCAAVAAYERSQAYPRIATLRAIARALDTTAADLLTGTDDEARSDRESA